MSLKISRTVLKTGFVRCTPYSCQHGR